MPKNNQKNKNIKINHHGFTIIEVVLVLAIAGLIFLIVFLALPGLQRSRRDTQRKSDAQKFIGLLENYASNNGGTYPGGDDNGNWNCNVSNSPSWKDFYNNYLLKDGSIKDPSTGIMYKYMACHDGSSSVGDQGSWFIDNNIKIGGTTYSLHAQCDGNKLRSYTTIPASSVGFWIQLESDPAGGYCVDNS